MREVMETGSQRELEQRLALVGPEDTARGFFFNGALQVVRNLEDPAALERCLAAAGGSRFMTFFSYPVSALNRLLYTAGWVLSEKQGGFEAAMRYLGHKVVPDYLESAPGRAFLMLAGGEPRRTLQSFPTSYRTAMRHGDCLVRWTGSHGGLVTLAGCTLPLEYFAGAIQGVFASMRMVNVNVVGRPLGLGGLEFDISW